MIKAHKAANSTDLLACLSERSNHYFSPTTMVEGEKLGIEWALVMTFNQKQLKRTTQFVNAITAGVSTMFDKTHARLLVSMREAGEFNLTTGALTALAANKRSDAVNTRGVGLGAVNAKIKGAHGVTTVPTKVSNSIGKNGFMQHLGMTYAHPTHDREVFLNHEHPAIIKFFKVIDSMSAGQLETLMQGADKA